MMIDVTIRQLRYCVAVAEHLHFGRAAQSAGIAQPPLSVQIRNLERTLGVHLFRRSARVVELTLAGSTFVRRAREILAELDSAVSETRNVAAGHSGRLRIAYPSSLLYAGLSSIISRLRSARPGVVVELIESPSSHHAELISSRAADVAFARDAEDHPGIVRYALLQERLFVAFPHRHPLARRSRINPEQLAEEAMVFFPRIAHPVLHDRIISIFHRIGVTPRIVQESNEWLTVLTLVEAGIGVSIVPESFCSIRESQVRYSPLRTRVRSEVCVCVGQPNVSPLVALFVHLAGEGKTLRPSSVATSTSS